MCRGKRLAACCALHVAIFFTGDIGLEENHEQPVGGNRNYAQGAARCANHEHYFHHANKIDDDGMQSVRNISRM